MCLPPTWDLGRGAKHAGEGTDTLVLYVYYKPSTGVGGEHYGAILNFRPTDLVWLTLLAGTMGGRGGSGANDLQCATYLPQLMGAGLEVAFPPLAHESQSFPFL